MPKFVVMVVIAAAAIAIAAAGVANVAVSGVEHAVASAVVIDMG